MIDRGLKALKRLLVAAVVAGLLWVAFATYVLGETTTVTSNSDAPLVTRTAHTLTSGPQRTTTTVARHASAASTTAGPPYTAARLLLIDGTTVYELERTPAVMMALFMATAGTR